MKTLLSAFALFLAVTISNIALAQTKENIYMEFETFSVPEEYQEQKISFEYVTKRHNQVVKELLEQRVLDDEILKHSEDLTAFVQYMGEKVISAMNEQDKINKKVLQLKRLGKTDNSAEVKALTAEFNAKERYVNMTIYRISLASLSFEQLVKNQATNPYFLAATKEISEADITEENVDIAYAYMEISDDMIAYLDNQNFPSEVDNEKAMYGYAHKYLLENAPSDDAPVIEKIIYVLRLGAVSQLFVETIEAKGYGL